MKKLLVLLAATFAAAWLAVPAFADDGLTTNTGFVKVCKDAGAAPAVTGVFAFKIDGIPDLKEVWVGQCTDPIKVTPVDGAVSITEMDYVDADGFHTDSYSSLAAVHTTSYLDDPDGAIVANSLDLHKRTVKVKVTLGDESKVTIVHFVNDPKYGYYEICKHQVEGAGLTGQSFTYTVEGAMGYSQDVTVPVGSCSPALYAPAGHVIVSEGGDAAYVTSIETLDEHDLISADLEKATALVKVRNAPLGFTADTSIVTFTNNSAQLEICKLIPTNGSLDPEAVYSFTVNGVGYSVNGSLAHWTRYDEDAVYGCVLAGRYRAGTAITVKEIPKVGERVKDIFFKPWDRGKDAEFSGNDYTGQMVTFTIQAGDTTVYYKNIPWDPQPLKICKLGAPTGGSVDFTITGPRYDEDGALTTGSDKVSVPVGSCSDPVAYPFAGAQVITEAAGAYHLTGVVATTDEWNGDRLAAVDLAGGKATVWVGDGLTEVTFTDATGAASGSSPSTTTVAQQSLPATTATTVSVSKPTKATKSLTVKTARIVTVGSHRYVVVRINGTAKTARIHLALLNKQHRVIGRFTRYVATNKAVRVGNLRLAKTIAGVKVTL